MKILLFGPTGMVGDGVLRWLIASTKVSHVTAVSRRALSVQHPKLETVLETDMFHLKNVHALRDFDACLFCLGVSSIGMSAEDYRQLTFDLTVAVARQLLAGNPRMAFEYISGEGTDANSRRRWARVKAETESALLNVGFRDAYALRPSFVQPMRGVRSRMRSVRWLYTLTAPIFPFLQKCFSRWVTSTDLQATAMLQLAMVGSEKKTLNTRELNALASQAAGR
jgi:uncharacterized protein YbjT (DUF2867 family)